jgi:hypothetical protein
MYSIRVSVVAAIAAVTLTTTAQAQDSKFAGISGGASLSDMRSNLTNTSSRWGGMAGVFAGYRRSYAIGVLEANWVQKGGKDVTGDGSTRIDYIEIPFLIGGGTETPSGILFRVYTGIGIGFSISCSSTSTSAQRDCDRKNSTEWSWPIGLLIGRSIGDGPMFAAIDGRYSIGLSDTFEGASLKNYSWQFRLLVGRRL